MKWRFGYTPFANHNDQFAKAVLKAFVAGRKIFRFMNNSYETEKYIESVREDLRKHAYRIEVA